MLKGYKISLEPGVNWNLFLDERSGSSLNLGVNISNVLRLVKCEFEEIFGVSTVNSHPTVSVLYTCDAPQTFRANKLIFLSSTGSYYLQHIYQFSHELCHFMVPSEVCAAYRWFEETLCQAMSWFILQRLYDKRVASPCRELAMLYPAIEDYIRHDMRKRCSLHGLSLPDYLAQNQLHLRELCYDRERNAAIAYEIYPLLTKYPALWTIIPHLHKLSPSMNLSEAILFLIRAADVEKDGGDKFMQRVSQQGLVVAQGV